MLTPGLVYSDSNRQFEYHPEFIPYYKKVNQIIFNIAVSKGKVDVDEDKVIYCYKDKFITCLFLVWFRDDIDRYEMLINPQAWNDLPPDADVKRLRVLGLTKVYSFQYHDGYPMLFSHIPGNWKRLLKNYL